jgi:hypothetical protein
MRVEATGGSNAGGAATGGASGTGGSTGSGTTATELPIERPGPFRLRCKRRELLHERESAGGHVLSDVHE